MSKKEKRVIMVLNIAIVIVAGALIVNLIRAGKRNTYDLAKNITISEETDSKTRSEKTEVSSDPSQEKSTQETLKENDSRVKTQKEIKELMADRSSKLFPDINQRYLEDEEIEMLRTYEQVQYAIDGLYALNGRTFVENHSVIKKYFTKQSDGKYYKIWYNGGTSATIDREDFNKYGQKNLDLLVSRREELSN